eukprot:IDg12257t1
MGQLAGAVLDYSLWARPPCEQLDPAKDALSIMQVDVSEARRPTPDGSAIINLFGLTRDGASVLLHVHSFYHYMFVPALPAISPDALQDALEKRLRKMANVDVAIDEKNPRNVARAPKSTGFVKAVELVQRRNIMNYIPNDPELTFSKSHCATTTYPWISPDARGSPSRLVNTTLKETNKRTTHAQIEATVHANDIIAHRPEGDWLHTAPLRRLSFDIECAGRKGIFPEPEHDSVIQIANYISDHGSAEPSAKVVFTLNTCAPIVGATVLPFKTERELLAAWCEFVCGSDPDILTGYNIVNFDLPYLIDRAKILDVKSFPFLGRLRGVETTMRKTKMSSSAFGTHESRSFALHGRVVFDVLQLITREYKLRSYSLNSVSAEFLGEQKEDVHYSIISDLQRGDEQTRRRLAVYCLKDAFLPIRILDKLLFLTNYIEMARVTGIPLGWLVSRGHMIKVTDGPAFGALQSLNRNAEHVAELNPDDYERTPCGNVFVKRSVKQGILTTMLEELLGARKQAKQDLKEAKDPFLKSVLNGRQLALKISANAVYGFTGATVGKLPCMEISASTTAYGRQMIENTKTEVEKRYKDADVVYGDTDSVMIRFGKGKSLAECMKLGEEAAEAISTIFPKPVKLEFEKCYYPYLLVNKKRYAGLLWTNTEKHDKMDCK